MLVFLLAANVLAGVSAVALRYPSLWGATDVFTEYAVPFPLSWALFHLATLIPLAILAYRIPGQPLAWQRKYQLIFLGVIVVCFLADVLYGGGRFHRVPFLLFPAVDCAVLLILSVCFQPPWKALGYGLVLSVLIFVATQIDFSSAPTLRSEISEPGEPAPSQLKSLLQPWIVHDDKAEKIWVYNIEVVPIVQPEEPPFPKQICDAAIDVYKQMKTEQPKPVGYTERIKFHSHPWFEPRGQLIYPSGGLLLLPDGGYQCAFVYPVDDQADPGKTGK